MVQLPSEWNLVKSLLMETKYCDMTPERRNSGVVEPEETAVAS
jgi:hypothetical protein